MDLPTNGELIPVGGGDNIPLLRSPLTIGRRESCDVCLWLADTAERIAQIRASEQGREGVQSFLDKRKPGWLMG